VEVPVKELLREYVCAIQVPGSDAATDTVLVQLVDDFRDQPAAFKRDMRRLLEKDASSFLRSACRVLKASMEGPGAEYLMNLLWSSRVLLASLADPALFPLEGAISLAKRWSEQDALLDIKLLHLARPGEFVPDGRAALKARRALAVVGALPVRQHILLPLGSFLRSPDERVRSQATRLFGRANQNPEWVRQRLEETDARIRANAVESLWGDASERVGEILMQAASDANHRVAANALIGLHFRGANVTEAVRRMARRSEPLARAAAAFAMGQIRDAGFKALLEDLVKDANGHVRRQALRSLIQIRRGQRQAGSPEDAKTGAPAPAETARGGAESPRAH